MPTATARWVKTLREAIKQEHGFGWNIREISGKVQLTRRHQDMRRSSVVLEIPWNSESITPVLGLVAQIRLYVDEQDIELKEAYRLAKPEEDKPPRNPRVFNLESAMKDFRKYKTLDTGEVKESTYLRAYEPIMQKIKEALTEKPIPRNAKEMLSKIRDQYGGEPGSRTRQIRIQYTAQFLRFAVTERNAPETWLPPVDLKNYVGKSSSALGYGSSTPLKDHQVNRLLAGIKDKRWGDAIRLMTCFGLRPVELRYLQGRGNKLHIGYSKRTSRGSTAPADIPGLDPVGLVGESHELITRLQIGDLVLPPLGSSDGQAAVSVRQYLNRRKIWNELKEEVETSGGRLSPYSFRHGFALRAHETYGLSPRMTAALMRHSLQTHMRHYGHWTDGNTIEEAVERGRRRAAGST